MNRQSRLLCFTLGVLVTTCGIELRASESNKKPNVILILCDDLGYADIGAFGNPKHQTPHIDRMAREGMRLTSFYSTCGVCTPSRASIMTGCYPKRVGLHESESGQWVLFPGNQRGLNPKETTIAEVLKTQGYSTAIVGKWHLGDQPQFLPTRHGFDQYFGIPYSNDMGLIDRPKTNYPPTPLVVNGKVREVEPDQRYVTRRYTETAIEFIESNKEKPFFLYLPHSMPHWPQYSSKDFHDKSGNKYWGDCIQEIDWSTGQILNKLKELGIDDNTLVIFTSDNGGALHHGANNEPLRGGKGTTWEGGHRVCCVARWPSKIKAGSKTDELAVTFDLFPTIAQLAGATLENYAKIDGKDISSLLFAEGKSPHEAYFYYFRGNLNAVRAGQWKLFVKRKPNRRSPAKLERPELYNLAEDIGEKNNVADQHPEVVKQLMSHLQTMRDDLGDGKEFTASAAREPGHVANSKTLTQQANHELTQIDVFTAGEEGYHTYRIPSLIKAANGDLLAICEGRKNNRSDHGDIDLIFKRSSDNGVTWGKIETIYEEGETENITIGNPCPVVDYETNVLWMTFCRNNDDVLVTYSKDHGASWSEPVDITASVKKKDWGWYATGPGVGIQLTQGNHNGRLVIPCDHREKKNGRWIKMSHVFYSDDHGKTWKLGGTVGDHTDECQVVQMHDGRLMINMRNYWAAEGQHPEHGGKRALSISNDGGQSWGAISFDDALIEPICQASFLKHNNDHFRKAPFLFSNPASKSGRHHMTVRLSDDQGKTWPVSKVIHEGPAAYSCLTTLADRSVGCLYERGDKHAYEKLTFARFTVKWLRSK